MTYVSSRVTCHQDNLIDWEKLMGMELDPPFESDLEYEKPSRQAVTQGFTQLDFFCQARHAPRLGAVGRLRTSTSAQAPPHEGTCTQGFTRAPAADGAPAHGRTDARFSRSVPLALPLLPPPYRRYTLQMVDYMKTSMSMRTTWPLKPEDQKIFEDFDFVSNKVGAFSHASPTPFPTPLPRRSHAAPPSNPPHASPPTQPAKRLSPPPMRCSVTAM